MSLDELYAVLDKFDSPELWVDIVSGPSSQLIPSESIILRRQIVSSALREINQIVSAGE